MLPSLLPAAELLSLLSDGADRPEDRPTVLDVRWELGQGAQPDAYAAAHLPGAVFVDLDTELAAPAGPGGRHPLPAAADFEAAMRRAGVRAARGVVVYDAGPALGAARAWWLLRYFGHRDTAVLDGGLAAWRAAGGALESGRPEPPHPGDFVARPRGMPVLDAEAAAALARDGLLFDARAPERFRGEHEPLDPVAGHIPGAINRPMASNLEDDGRWLDPERLRESLARDGAVPGVPIGAYCGSGITAAHAVLALERAGIAASLYPGSWSEWVTDPSRPVATGP